MYCNEARGLAFLLALSSVFSMIPSILLISGVDLSIVQGFTIFQIFWSISMIIAMLVWSCSVETNTTIGDVVFINPTEDRIEKMESEIEMLKKNHPGA